MNLLNVHELKQTGFCHPIDGGDDSGGGGSGGASRSYHGRGRRLLQMRLEQEQHNRQQQHMFAAEEAFERLTNRAEHRLPMTWPWRRLTCGRIQHGHLPTRRQVGHRIQRFVDEIGHATGD